MPKEIMLMEEVEGLGKEGDVVEVAEGYARNYLIPKKIGSPVNKAARRFLIKREKQREIDNKENLAEAKSLADKIAQVSCTIPVKTGKEDKLFGSVHEGMILNALKVQGLELQKDQIVLDESIDNLGVFEVPIKLHPEVVVQLKVWVVKE